MDVIRSNLYLMLKWLLCFYKFCNFFCRRHSLMTRLWLFICCKTKLKKKKFFFFWKIFVFFAKYTLFAEKNLYEWKKSFILKNIFTEKNFFTEKNINENVKNIYLISKMYFCTENVVLQIKYKSFLNIYSFWS